MNTEIEAKFADVNHDELRDKLKALGAILEIFERKMRRVTIDTPEMKAKGAFLRIRDEGTRATVTYKQFNSLSVDGAREVEITVNDFETTVKLFAQVGLTHGSYQETKRETWKLGDTEVVLDTWPWLKPFVEIEGLDIETVKTVSSKLGFQWDNAVFGDVMSVYRVQYPHLAINDTVGNLAEVKFEDPLPDFLIDRS